MHSALVRVQNVFGFFTTVAFCVAILVALSVTTPSEPPSQAIIWDIIINSEAQKNPSTPFTLYSMLTSPPKKAAKTRKPSKSKQEVELAPGLMQLKNSKPKYQITDISGKLSGITNATLELGWNVQPWVGALTWTMGKGGDWGRWKGLEGGRSKAFDIPAVKVKGVNQEAVKGSGKPEKAAEASPIVR
ncbi:MAG: hypothetical protein LQ350_001741 [Teloschistes chrysophthalmus]|nr:MAG: hypothetical protein LQ350_001741 [Niorma chrysophthalma]